MPALSCDRRDRVPAFLEDVSRLGAGPDDHRSRQARQHRRRGGGRPALVGRRSRVAPGAAIVAAMYEELEVLREVTHRLEGAGIAYMLTGSMALNHYAQPRMTRDVDLVAELRLDDADRLAELFGDDFGADLEEIREAIARGRLFNLIHAERVVKVDIVVRKDAPFRVEEFSRRRRVDYAGISLWIVSPEDLLLSKLYWAKDSHSDFQLRDVRNLIAAVAELDWAYLERWASELGVGSLLEEVHG